jgi:ABC-type Fe3+-hydroxamate transport system substrate-binding protein
VPSASLFARRKPRPDALLSVAVAAAVALVALLTAATAREVIDSAGRKVEVPDRIERIMAAGPRDFYRLFYQVDLTEAQLDQLLEGAK